MEALVTLKLPLTQQPFSIAFEMDIYYGSFSDTEAASNVTTL